jgi:hypothetical protein
LPKFLHLHRFFAANPCYNKKSAREVPLTELPAMAMALFFARPAAAGKPCENSGEGAAKVSCGKITADRAVDLRPAYSFAAETRQRQGFLASDKRNWEYRAYGLNAPE